MPDYPLQHEELRLRTRRVLVEFTEELHKTDECHETAKQIMKDVLQEVSRICETLPTITTTNSNVDEVGKDAVKDIENSFDNMKAKCMSSFDSAKAKMLGVAKNMKPNMVIKVAEFMKKLEGVFSPLWEYICFVGNLIWEGMVWVYEKAKSFFSEIAEIIKNLF